MRKRITLSLSLSLGLLLVILMGWLLLVKRIQAEDSYVVRHQYHLREGWNLIGFPMRPITVTKASELISYVTNQGGVITTVSRWDGDRWQEYVAVGNSRYGGDFPLQQGQAYFVASAMDVTIEIAGARDLMGEIRLNPGWNVLSLDPASFGTAQNFLDKAHVTGAETATEIDRWLSGNWQALVKRWYTKDNIQEYGENFAIESPVGYMVKSVKEVRLTP